MKYVKLFEEFKSDLYLVRNQDNINTYEYTYDEIVPFYIFALNTKFNFPLVGLVIMIKVGTDYYEKLTAPMIQIKEGLYITTKGVTEASLSSIAEDINGWDDFVKVEAVNMNETDILLRANMGDVENVPLHIDTFSADIEKGEYLSDIYNYAIKNNITEITSQLSNNVKSIYTEIGKQNRRMPLL